MYTNAVNNQFRSMGNFDSELNSEIQNTQQEINNYNTQIQGYNAEGDSFETEKGTEENNLSTANEQYALAKENTANFQNIYNDARSTLRQAADKLAEAKKSNDPKAIAAAESNYNAAQEAVSNAKNDLDNAIDQEKEYEEKIKNIEEVIENLDTQIDVNNNSINETQNNLSISEAELAQLLAELEAQQAENDENNINQAEDKNNSVNTDEIMLAEIEAELQKQLEEVQADAESKTGLGKLWNGVTGLFGGGTKGETNDLLELQKKLDSLKTNGGSLEDIANLYSLTFGNEPDINEIVASAQSQEELNQSGKITLEDGTQVSQDEIAEELMSQVQSLSENFDNTVKSQGIFSTIIGKVNNVVGLGTTENMTKAQLETFQKNAEKLQNAETPEEFAAAYKAITGEPLSQNSVSQLFEGTSKVENSKAAESMMDYEATNENIKNTATAIGVGIAVAATGPVGALLIGAGATVAVNGIDAVTQNNGKSFGEKLVDYAKGDLVKDALVGGLNGLTGKLGNMAGEKLVQGLATKTLGKEVAGEIAEKAIKEAATKGLAQAAQSSAASEALKGTLNFGQRVVTEFVDGAVDAALSSSGEYLLTAAAGENGNFTNADGKYFNDDGSLALFNNFKENFNAQEMGEQVFFSTLMGGAMSAGMQEGMSLIGGIFGAKSTADALDSELSEYDKAVKSGHEFGKSYMNSDGEWMIFDKTTGKLIPDTETPKQIKILQDMGLIEKEDNIIFDKQMTDVQASAKTSTKKSITYDQKPKDPDAFTQLQAKKEAIFDGDSSYMNLRELAENEYDAIRKRGDYIMDWGDFSLKESDAPNLQKAINGKMDKSTGFNKSEYASIYLFDQGYWMFRGGVGGSSVHRASLNVIGDPGIIKELDELMKTGKYVDATGKIVKVDNFDGSKMFDYKTPKNIDQWDLREDPISIYFRQEPDDSLRKAITDISSKYQRGSLSYPSSESTPWISFNQVVSDSDIDKLYELAGENETLRYFISGYCSSCGIKHVPGGTNHYGDKVSEGMIQAVKNIVEQYKQFHNIS